MYTLNNNRIARGTLEIPNQGIWYFGEMIIDTDTTINEGSDVTIQFMDKTLSGTFVDAENYAGYVKGSVIGGKNTMSNVIESIGYAGITLGQIVRDVASLTGHTFNLQSDASLMAISLVRWDKIKAKASDIIDKLLEPQIKDGRKAIWRIMLDGTLWVGYEDYPEVTIKYELLDKQTQKGYWLFNNEEQVIEPLQSVSGQRIRETVYRLENEKLDMLFNFYQPNHIQAYDLSSQTREFIYSRIYRMKVLNQQGNGTVNLVPEPEIELLKNGLREVPIIYPMPDMKINVSTGAICYVFFANSDPSYPRVIAWEFSPQNLIEVVFADSKGGRGVARLNDDVHGGTITTQNVVNGAPVQFFYTPFGGLPIGPSPTLVLNGGKIRTSSNTVKAGD